MYLSASKLKHYEWSIANSGLVINPMWPHIGVSPDGIVSYSCHVVGILEIKYPYCHRGTDIQRTSDACLKKVDRKLFLYHTHSFYYQVQCQYHVCDVSYADFCVCTCAIDEDQNRIKHTHWAHLQQHKSLGWMQSGIRTVFQDMPASREVSSTLGMKKTFAQTKSLQSLVPFYTFLSDCHCQLLH